VVDLLPVSIIAILILVNGLFVAAEFAVVGAPRAPIERLASQGHHFGKRVRQILRDPKRQGQFIATTQLGVTLTSLGLGMYGEHVVASWIAQRLLQLGALRWVAAHALAGALAVAFLTYFHIVLGEMVPKLLALQRPQRMALWLAPLIELFRLACYPLVIGLNWLGNSFLGLLGIDRRESSRELFHTTEELEYIIRESQEGGLLRRESAQVLQELFKFGDLTAREVMVPRVKIIAIPKGAPAPAVEAILRSSPHTRYPIYDRDLDHIVGMVHMKDILGKLLGSESGRDLPTRHVPHVPETMPIDVVLSVMRRVRAQMVVVMDEYGGTAGLLTVEDLFEEVIGEISEGTADPPKIRESSAGRLYVAGTVRLDELGQRLNQVLEDDRIHTVSGLVLSLLGRPPQVGDAIVYHQFRFEVTGVEGRGVKECVVSAVSGPDQATEAAQE
jgi:CBS domain containing-hemolysin-like protein